MLITVLVMFGFTARVFAWYHQIRRHDRRLWRPWAVLANSFVTVACVVQFLMMLGPDQGYARLDLLFAFILVICTWVECTR